MDAIHLRRLQLAYRMRKIPMIMDIVAERAASIGCWFNQENWKDLLWYRKPCKKGDESYNDKIFGTALDIIVKNFIFTFFIIEIK